MEANLLIFVVASFLCGFSVGNEVEQAFKDNGIVPDVIDVAPSNKIEITYEDTNVFGNEMTPASVKEIPKVNFEASEGKYYTVAMVDPDAPSRKNPIRREWQHWLVVNIPGSKLSEGETLSEYVGAGPPKDTGLHRYVFLVYQQPEKLTFEEPRRSRTHGSTRGSFSIKKFAEKHKLGNPIAGNFFEAQFDDSAFRDNSVVPQLIDAAPSSQLEVDYAHSNVKVNLGNEVAPKDVLMPPRVSYQADPSSFYTLLMIGPDMPTIQFPLLGEWLHWLVVNIPGPDVEKGETLWDYMEAGPLPFTGFHRFIFLVFKQPGRIRFDEPFSGDNFVITRPFFSTRNFIQKYDLGNPVAGDLFNAQFDESVPGIYFRATALFKMQIPQLISQLFNFPSQVANN